MIELVAQERNKIKIKVLKKFKILWSIIFEVSNIWNLKFLSVNFHTFLLNLKIFKIIIFQIHKNSKLFWIQKFKKFKILQTDENFTQKQCQEQRILS